MLLLYCLACKQFFAEDGRSSLMDGGSSRRPPGDWEVCNVLLCCLAVNPFISVSFSSSSKLNEAKAFLSSVTKFDNILLQIVKFLLSAVTLSNSFNALSTITSTLFAILDRPWSFIGKQGYEKCSSHFQIH